MQVMATALGDIARRLTAIFEILDLSFFLSGGLVIALCLWLSQSLGLDIAIDPDTATFAELFLLVLIAYGAGLVCFVVGRWLRRSVWERGERRHNDVSEGEWRMLVEGEQLGPDFSAAMKALDALSSDPNAPRSNLKARYALLWAAVRQAPALKESYDFLRSSWVRAAICDGLSAAAVLWIGGLVYLRFGTDPVGRMPVPQWMVEHPTAWAMLVMGVVAGLIACLSEGGRTERSLARDIVASIVWEARWCDIVPRPPPPPGPPPEPPPEHTAPAAAE